MADESPAFIGILAFLVAGGLSKNGRAAGEIGEISVAAAILVLLSEEFLNEKNKRNSSLITMPGHVTGTLVALHFVIYHAQRFISHPLSSYSDGFGLADESRALIAILALVIAQCLKDMEDRLSGLEGAKLPPQKEPP